MGIAHAHVSVREIDCSCLLYNFVHYYLSHRHLFFEFPHSIKSHFDRGVWGESRQLSETQAQNNNLAELIGSCIDQFDGKGGFSPNEDANTDILNGTDQDLLESRMQRKLNTATLFTGAENGLLPYLTDLQLEVLFWWSQIKLFERKYSRTKTRNYVDRIMKCTHHKLTSSETITGLSYSEFVEEFQ
jgi:hypothetical protein